MLIFNCFEVFPVFDQPDLKAKMTLTIITHSKWVALSNEREQKNLIPADLENKSGSLWMVDFFSLEDRQDLALYEFDQTKEISTYLFVVVAGPYLCVNEF
jgi:aminopeptidase N